MTRPFSEALRARPLFFEPVPPLARTPPSRAEERIASVVRWVDRYPASMRSTFPNSWTRTTRGNHTIGPGTPEGTL